MKFHTGLRPWANRRLEKIEHTDLVVGIPCYNNDSTIEHVIDTLSEGIAKHYRHKKAIIIISDGGSTDDTREAAKEKTVYSHIEKIVTIYRGIPGKGTPLRMIFEAASFLDAEACLLFDSDLRSITPEWVKALADPVFSHGHDFVAPVYSRYKYDATITNNIAYNMTRALYGKRVRQPIGGDFGLSLAFNHSITDLANGFFLLDIFLITYLSHNFLDQILYCHKPDYPPPYSSTTNATNFFVFMSSLRSGNICLDLGNRIMSLWILREMVGEVLSAYNTSKTLTRPMILSILFL